MKLTLRGMLASKEQAGISAQARLVLSMSVPAILAQISFIIMQYIDAAMVGSLGAEASASIGLVTSTTWLFYGLTVAAAVGVSIQAAQKLGAGRLSEARSLLRQALLVDSTLAVLMAAIGFGISGYLPRWLGGAESICAASASYFAVFALALPCYQLSYLAGAMIQSSGNMRVPSLVNGLACFADIFWNFLFIFPSRTVAWGDLSLWVPGAGLGVTGAALGTAASELMAMAALVYFVCRHSRLRLHRGETWSFRKEHLKKALKLGAPVGLENVVMNSAMIATTGIIAPLGPVAIAANSFAVTAEALCYMPGYGISSAISPIVGQSLGAGRRDLIRRFARIAVGAGALIMGLCGFAMYFAAPLVFAFLTPDLEVQELGTKVLRIEMFAEPLFAVAIIAAGALRGAGDTLVPSLLNIASVWGIRVTLCLLLVGTYGLAGAWIAMAVELCCRGGLMYFRLCQEKWKG